MSTTANWEPICERTTKIEQSPGPKQARDTVKGDSKPLVYLFSRVVQREVRAALGLSDEAKAFGTNGVVVLDEPSHLHRRSQETLLVNSVAVRMSDDEVCDDGQGQGSAVRRQRARRSGGDARMAPLSFFQIVSPSMLISS